MERMIKMNNLEEIIRNFYEHSVFLYVMGVICLLSIALKFFLLITYHRMIQASESITITKNSWMKNMKNRFENSYQKKLAIQDVEAYVDKHVNKTKVGGLLLSTWENISGQAIALCLLIGSCAGIMGVVYHCVQGQVLFTFFMGAWTAIIVNIVDNIVNIKAHRQILRYNLIDYFENYLKVRMEIQNNFLKDKGEWQDNIAALEQPIAAIESECFGYQESKKEKRMQKKAKKREEKERKKDLLRMAAINKQTKKEEKRREKIERREAEKRKKEEILQTKRQLKEAKALAATIEQQVKKDNIKKEKMEQRKNKELKKQETKKKEKIGDQKEIKNSKAYMEKMRLKEDKERERRIKQEKKIEVVKEVKQETEALVKEEVAADINEDSLVEEILREYLM